MTAPAVARHTGIAKTTLYMWTPGSDRKLERALKKATPLLGLKSDAAIARKVGLSTECIRSHRMHRGLQPFNPHEERQNLQQDAEKRVAQELRDSWRAP